MKEKITTILFIMYITSFSLLHIIIKDNEISKTERRKLAQVPDFELNNDYSEKLEKYLLEQFPFKDTYRNIKAKYNYKILNKLENNSIYIKDNYIFKSNYPTNKKSIENFNNTIKKINTLLTHNNKTYIMIIPDKNYYLKTNNFLHIDYDYIYNEIDKLNIKQIDIKNILNLYDYYETDTHWKQENLEKIIKEICKNLELEYKHETYKYNQYNKFYGVYYGESAIKRKPETLTYLTNETKVKVKYLENENLKTIYNLEKLKSLDPYEIYLDGASAFIEIINETSTSNKELVIFRDSFASSITPLLVNYYQKITLIDNRYINIENIKKHIEFNNQDVIFMYSTLIINNSFSLKK